MSYVIGIHYQIGEMDTGMAANVPVDGVTFIRIRSHLWEEDLIFDDDYGFAQLHLP
jgi:hypothetical protein